ncbi:energy transducer TonB [bacterium]|nr:energy transducer TonB [bacterium]
MSERPRYMTEIRRGRERRYRRTIAWSTAGAVVFHVLLVLIAATSRERPHLVMRSGYRGEFRLLPAISILREPDVTESEAQARGRELGGSGFRVINLVIAEVELPRKTPIKAEVEELNRALGDDPRNLRDASRPQPAGQEIVIERLVEPIYPQSAIDREIEGVAVFVISVDATGEVRNARLVESEVSEDCNIEAQRALLQWRFAPYLVDGRPVPFHKFYRIQFDLLDEFHRAQEARSKKKVRPLPAPRTAP